MSKRRAPLQHRPLRSVGGARPSAKIGAAAPKVAAPRADAAPRAELTFSEAMAASRVARLAEGRSRVRPTTTTPPASARFEPRPDFVVEGDADELVGYRRDVGIRGLARIGATPLATLDLHRLTRAAAHRRLQAFIAAEVGRTDKTVLVIVGKGRHSPGGEGTLRSEIGSWLSAGPCASRVLAFKQAPPLLGGSGAVLVLLRR